MKKNLLPVFGIGLFLAVGILIISFGRSAKSLDTSLSHYNTYEEALQQFGLESRMAHYGVAGISFGVIKDGKLDWAKGYGVLQQGTEQPVTPETLFSVGSVSKVGTAVMILKLHEMGMLDIDQNVNNYLSSWSVPENSYTREHPVTLRAILSHTAGLTVHGFADFSPEEPLPSTIQILNGEAPAKNDPVRVNIPVGSRFRYSGGGTTVSQLVIEDAARRPFHKAADSILFQALDMRRSSYQNPLPEVVGNIAKAHNRNGNPVALPRGYQSMPEAAASGLWTTPTDLSKLIITLMKGYEGENDYLSQAIVKDMMTPVHPSDYGLGPKIKEVQNTLQFMHGGSNDSYRARFMGTLDTQNGIIIFTNGTAGNQLINELMPLFDELL